MSVGDHVEALERHIRTEQAEGRSVLVLTVHHPASVLLRRFKASGVNLDRLFIMDAVGARAGVERTNDPEHLMYLPGPTQLELIGLRTHRAIEEKAEGPATVVICTVNAFGLYNAPEALEEMARYALFMLAAPTCRIDFVLEDEAPMDRGLIDALERLVREQGQLG